MRNALVAALLASLAPAVACAAPPDLKGTWWDEWNTDRYEFQEGGKGVWTASGEKESSVGAFSFPDDGTLKFVPEGGPARTWKISMRGELLAMTDADGTERQYRRESSEERWGRAADVFAEMVFLEKAKKAEKDAGRREALSLRSKEIEPRLGGLCFSLGNWKDEELLKQLLVAAKKRRPDMNWDDEKALKAGQEAGRLVSCKNSLKQIGVYIALYESKHRKYPKSFADIQVKDLAKDPKLFHCPLTDIDDAYVYVYPEAEDETSPDFIIAYDRDPHPDGSRNVLLFFGRVETLSAEEFEEALKAGELKQR